MPIASKPASGRSVGIISLPPQTEMIPTNELTPRALESLGIDPNSIPDPLTYPKGMAVSLVRDSQDRIRVEPCELGHNDNQFIGFLALDTLSSNTRVAIITIRGSETPIVAETGITIANKDELFLSDEVGRVTNVPHTLANKNLVRVGFAISHTQFILNTDVIIGLV